MRQITTGSIKIVLLHQNALKLPKMRQITVPWGRTRRKLDPSTVFLGNEFLNFMWFWTILKKPCENSVCCLYTSACNGHRGCVYVLYLMRIMMMG